MSNNELAPLQVAFSTVFRARLKHFGKPAGEHEGISDGNEGVQWNAGISRQTRQSFLGVNLEGMKYDGWPVGRLIQRELATPTLLYVVRRLSNPSAITLSWRRDYWQVTARPPIRENMIISVTLDQLDAAEWNRALLEARDCLDAENNYQGRANQIVTLVSSGRKVEGEVSPHLHFAQQLWVRAPSDSSVRVAEMKKVRQALQPLYDFVAKWSVP